MIGVTEKNRNESTKIHRFNLENEMITFEDDKQQEIMSKREEFLKSMESKFQRDCFEDEKEGART